MYQNRNVIRYELRYKNRIAENFNKSEIKASDLYNEDFYIQLIENYKTTFQNINKIRQINLNYEYMKSKKAFKDYFYYLGLKQHFKNEVEASREIEILYKKGIISDRMEKSRLKNEVKKAFTLPELTTDNEPILELEKKIIEACKYYR